MNKLQEILAEEKQYLHFYIKEYLDFKSSGILQQGYIRNLAKNIEKNININYSDSQEIVLKWCIETAAEEWLKNYCIKNMELNY